MKFSTALTLPLLSLLPIHTGQAVTIATPVGNDSANHEIAPAAPHPSAGVPWDNVLNVNGNSGVYLGDGWVLTARHVFSSGTATVSYNGTNFSSDNSFILNIQNPNIILPETGAISDDSDLRLFRLTQSIVGLPSISLGAVGLAENITMIGRGGDPRTKRWGTNNVETQNSLANDGTRHTVVFSTDNDTGTEGEGQAIGGDSGGGVFHKDGADWKLVGIMIGVNGTTTTFSAQLDSTLGTYDSQINDFMTLHGSAPVPEPSSTALIGVAAFGFILRRKRA